MPILFVCLQLVLGQLEINKFVTKCLNLNLLVKNAKSAIKTAIFVLIASAVIVKYTDYVLFWRAIL
jgi:hypothetical protein